MYEMSPRIRDGSAYAATMTSNAASVKLWRNEHCDTLCVSGEAGSDVLDRVHDTVGVAASVGHGDELIVVTADCLRDHEIDHIEGYVQKHGLFLVPSLRCRGGAKVCHLLAVSADDLTACFRGLVDSGFDVSVESKRAVSFASGGDPLLAPADMMSALTGRQYEALRLAHAGDYYDLPRGIETATIADEMGASRRTAEEHLCRAKRRVMNPVAQYML